MTNQLLLLVDGASVVMTNQLLLLVDCCFVVTGGGREGAEAIGKARQVQA
jgi:hypothetical protein